MRLVRDKNSKTGWTVLMVLRDVRLKGPLSHGRYVLAERKFNGRHDVNFGGNKKKPRVSVVIDWQPNEFDFKLQLKRKRLDRARALSPMLK